MCGRSCISHLVPNGQLPQEGGLDESFARAMDRHKILTRTETAATSITPSMTFSMSYLPSDLSAGLSLSFEHSHPSSEHPHPSSEH